MDGSWSWSQTFFSPYPTPYNIFDDDDDDDWKSFGFYKLKAIDRSISLIIFLKL